MSEDFFDSDSERTQADEWYRVMVYARTAEAINAALAELPRHFRIGKQALLDPAIWGPRGDSTAIAGHPWKVEIVGRAFRAFPASELENYLRTLTRDMGLQVGMAHITGLQAAGYSGRGYISSAGAGGSRVVESVTGGAAALAAGAGALAQGVGETAQGTGDFLGGTSSFLLPMLLIGAIILAIIALITAPKWLPAALGA